MRVANHALSSARESAVQGWFSVATTRCALRPEQEHGYRARHAFFDSEIQTTSLPNPVPIRTAWFNGGSHSDNVYGVGVYEFTSASEDKLSGPFTNGGGPFTANGVANDVRNPVKFWQASSGPPGTTHASVQLQPLDSTVRQPYRVRSMVAESYSDSYLAQQADAHEAGSAKFYESSNEYRVVSASYTGQHYEASGAIIIEAAMSSLPYNYDVNNALSYATRRFDSYDNTQYPVYEFYFTKVILHVDAGSGQVLGSSSNG